MNLKAHCLLAATATAFILISSTAAALDKALAKRAQLEGTWGTECDRPGVRVVYDPIKQDGKLTYKIIMHPDHLSIKGEILSIEELAPGRFKTTGQSMSVDKPVQGLSTGSSVMEIKPGGRLITYGETTTNGIKTVNIENAKVVANGKDVPIQSRCDVN